MPALEILDSPMLSYEGPQPHFNEKALEKLALITAGKIKQGPLADYLAISSQEDTHLLRFNGKEAALLAIREAFEDQQESEDSKWQI